MKTSILNTRIKLSTKEDLCLLSKTLDKPISTIVRDAIDNYITYSSKEQIDNVMFGGIELKDIELIQSLGFTEFIFWICDKVRDSEISEISELYIQFIKLIAQLHHHPLFSVKILSEFRKVSNELQGVLDGSYSSCYFKFPEYFNYQLLNETIHTLRYDEDNNRIILIN